MMKDLLASFSWRAVGMAALVCAGAAVASDAPVTVKLVDHPVPDLNKLPPGP